MPRQTPTINQRLEFLTDPFFISIFFTSHTLLIHFDPATQQHCALAFVFCVELHKFLVLSRSDNAVKERESRRITRPAYRACRVPSHSHTLTIRGAHAHAQKLFCDFELNYIVMVNRWERGVLACVHEGRFLAEAMMLCPGE